MFNFDRQQANSLMNHVKTAAKSLHNFVKPVARKVHEVASAIDTPTTYGLVGALAGPEAVPIALAAVKGTKLVSKYLKGDEVNIKDVPKDAMELLDATKNIRKGR
jgi:hypothetical protein